MENNKSLNQKFLYMLIYGMLGIFAGALEYLFLVFCVLFPVEFVVLTIYYKVSDGFIKNLENSFVIIGLMFFVAIVVFLGIYGYKKGKRRDDNKISKKKGLVLIVIAEFLILIPALYFFIQMFAHTIVLL